MTLDIIVACAILALVLVTGARHVARRAGLAERFAAGRQLSWLLLGGSMAAAFTSADTPLLIAGAVYLDGLSGNWFWWVSAPGVLATLFFFARLWRRSGVLTEMEVIELRYGAGPTARGLRVVRALFDGVVVNALVMASSTYALTMLLDALLRHRPVDAGNPAILAGAIVTLLFLATALYTAIVGFRGLVRADALQFALALVASGLLAWFALAALPHGIGTLRGLVASRNGLPIFDVRPADGLTVSLLLLGLGWCHTAPGNGMLVQRVVAARDEQSATLTVLTFAVLHYLARPWAWYLIGAAALYHLPALPRADLALPRMAATLLPPGLAGMLATGLLLAFTGSVNSRLNFGASYLVNDVIGVFRPGLGNTARRRVELLTILGLSIVSLAIAMSGALNSLRAVYQYLIVMAAGTAFVSIARWYWWRLTIWSEIASLCTALLLGNFLLLLGDVSHPRDFAFMMAANFLGGAAVAIIFAYAGPQTRKDVVAAFFDKVRPGGPGWRHFGSVAGGGLREAAVFWLLTNIMLFAAIFAVAALLAGRQVYAVVSLAILVACMWLMARAWPRLSAVLGWGGAQAG